jgi:DHA2 family multidrug resistance protein
MPRIEHKWLITLTVMVGTIMSALDSSIVNVALPYMRGSLGATVEQITWVATGYILSTVITMPLIALMGARFGRKRFYAASIFLFTVSSMLCGISWNLESLVVFRILQGIGGGAMIPIAQAILRESFSSREQGLAMGIYGLGIVLGPAIGPTLGGWLTDRFSWPWIFFINVPIGILDLILLDRFIVDPPYLVREKGPIDWSGLAFMIVGLGSLQLMLEQGERKDWFGSSFIIELLILAVAGIALFIWRELSTPRPAVNLRILKNVSFSVGTLLGGLLGMGLYGSLFLLPLLLQQLKGYTALESGIALIPRSLAMAVMMPLAGRLYNRIGPRLLIAGGLALSAFSFLQFSRFSIDIGFGDLAGPQILQGFGFGMIFVSLSTAALMTIEKARMGEATGLYNVVRQVFGSIGIAIAASQLTHGQAIFRSVLGDHMSVYNDPTLQAYGVLRGGMQGAGADPFTAQTQALRMLDAGASRQAAMMAYDRIFFMVVVLFVASIPLVMLLRNQSHIEEASEHPPAGGMEA